MNRICIRAAMVALAALAASGAAQPLPGFDVNITLSAKAAQRLQSAHEGITVWASYYGHPNKAGQHHVDEVGQIDLGHVEVRVPGRPGMARISATKLPTDRLKWIEGGAKVNVNVYTSRLSGDDNLLNCDFIDGDLAVVVTAQPITLHCGLIGEHIETRSKP